MKACRYLIPINLLMIPFVLLAQNDMVHLCKIGIGDVADEDPGLFMIMVMMLCVMIGACIVGAIFMALFLCITVAFIIGGTISMSVFVGFYKHSATKGFKFLMVAMSALLGGITGLVISFIAKAFLGLQLSLASSNIYFLLAGIVGGTLIGLASSAAFTMTYNFLKRKIKTT